MSEQPVGIGPGNSVEPPSKLRIEEFSKLLALCSTGLYVVGFLVVTSYLSTKGIYDQSLLSARYLLAGGLAVVVGGFYYFMVWRKVVYRVRIGIRWPTPPNQPLQIFLHTYYGVEFIYGCCYVSALVCSVLVADSQALLILIVLSTGFVFDSLLENVGAYQKWRLQSFIASMVLYATLCLVFLIYGVSRPPLLALAGTFLSFTFIGSIVISSPAWSSSEDRLYSRLYLAFYAVIAVFSFGATVYSRIDQRFGGQAMQKVEILLASEASEELKGSIQAFKNSTFLVFDSDTALTIQAGDPTENLSKVIKIDKKLIQAVVAIPRPANLNNDLGAQIRTLMDRN